MNTNALSFLPELEEIISQRAAADTDDSYTARLFERGTPYIAQKVGEEAVELAIAASLNKREESISEAADLIYHFLVLIRSREISLAEIVAELEARHS
ncbi:MAG: phosphoribosyl-ATP diphosphatase [Gammaproteobacteria bacterium]